MSDLTQLENRVTELEKEVKELRTTTTKDITNLQADVRYIKDGIDELKISMKELSSLPAKRWETIIASIITALTGGVVGALLMLIIRKG